MEIFQQKEHAGTIICWLGPAVLPYYKKRQTQVKQKCCNSRHWWQRAIIPFPEIIFSPQNWTFLALKQPRKYLIPWTVSNVLNWRLVWDTAKVSTGAVSFFVCSVMKTNVTALHSSFADCSHCCMKEMCTSPFVCEAPNMHQMFTLPNAETFVYCLHFCCASLICEYVEVA